jgi:hypothetical protein
LLDQEKEQKKSRLPKNALKPAEAPFCPQTRRTAEMLNLINPAYVRCVCLALAYAQESSRFATVFFEGRLENTRGT